MASLNKDSWSQKDILDDGIKILAVNVEQNDVHPNMSEPTNPTMMDLTQTLTKIPQMIKILRSITKMTDCTDNILQVGSNSILPPFSSLHKHMQQN